MNKKQILDKARAADVMIEIFTLLLFPAAQNEIEAAELIRKLDATGRRDLRCAAGRIDELLDDVTLAEMRERRPWKL
jgi:hypothetical protein